MDKVVAAAPAAAAAHGQMQMLQAMVADALVKKDSLAIGSDQYADAFIAHKELKCKLTTLAPSSTVRG